MKEEQKEDRKAHRNDQHMFPRHRGQHEKSTRCWCKPLLEEATKDSTTGRVWIHQEIN